MYIKPPYNKYKLKMGIPNFITWLCNYIY